jgi:hypothetical protein
LSKCFFENNPKGFYGKQMSNEKIITHFVDEISPIVDWMRQRLLRIEKLKRGKLK